MATPNTHVGYGFADMGNPTVNLSANQDKQHTEIDALANRLEEVDSTIEPQLSRDQIANNLQTLQSKASRGMSGPRGARGGRGSGPRRGSASANSYAGRVSSQAKSISPRTQAVKRTNVSPLQSNTVKQQYKQPIIAKSKFVDGVIRPK